MADSEICTAKRTMTLAHSEIDLKCDLYGVHGGRHRTVLSKTVTIFWEKK